MPLGTTAVLSAFEQMLGSLTRSYESPDSSQLLELPRLLGLNPHIPEI
jgi:hypothetical protein